MYNIEWNLKIITAIITFYLVIYGAEIFTIWTGYELFNSELSFQSFIFPALIILFFLIIISLGMCFSENLYSYSFFYLGIFLGYVLYSFLTSIIIRILDALLAIPPIIGLSLLIGIPLLICVYGYINAKRTRIVKHTLKYEGFKGKKTTILHLSDIHLGTIHQKSSVERIVRETNSLNPDIVVITGDVADGSLQVKEEWLRPFDKLTMPILYITGNHEMMNPKLAMLEVVNTTKIKHIGDCGSFKFNNINFIGVDFGINLKSALEDVKQEDGVPNILLCHVPSMTPEELSKFNIFLFLAGHTHGGQLFPFQLPAYAMNACFSGLYSDSENKHHVFVSDGVNNALIPMRVGSKRIFALITIIGNDEDDE